VNILEKVMNKAHALGFKIVELQDDNLHLTYKCRCGAVNASDTKSICRSSRTPNCQKCQNDKFKVCYDDIVQAFRNKGCQLLTKKDEYENNKQLLHYICECGNKEARITLHDLNRGRLCKICKYGTDNPSKSDIVKQKIVDTNIERHGVEYVMQNPKFFKKAQQSSYKRRMYVSPFGKEYMILGYEDMYLDELFQTYGDILIYAGEDERIPVISYQMKDGSTHRYYPDIFIPSQNKVIEIKSSYFFDQEKESVLRKAEATSRMYDFEIVIYGHKKYKDNRLFSGGFSDLQRYCSEQNSS
jgi:hypothetical protein